MPANRIYDFVIFGATGFTGQRVAQKLAEDFDKHPSLTWCVAGRNTEKLDKLLDDLGKKYSSASVAGVGKIIADVKDHGSLQEMAEQCRVLLSLVGPYRFHGHFVCRACIEAGTNYVDVSGEPDFLERAEYTFNGEAIKKQITLVGSAGFDSVPADLGCLFAQKEFAKQNAVCVQVDSFLEVQAGSKGMVGHSTTWECVVHGVSNVGQLMQLRKVAAKELPPAPRLRLPKSLSKNQSNGKSMFGFSDDRIGKEKHCFLFPGADASIVRRSQSRLLRAQENGERNESLDKSHFFPTQYSAFFCVKSWFTVFVLFVGGVLLMIFTKFELGRKFLIQYPKISTFSMFSHEGPTEEQMNDCTFSMTMFGRGYRRASTTTESSSTAVTTKSINNVLDECLSNGSPAPPHDLEMKVVVRGAEPGYVATPIYMIEIAKLVLESWKSNEILHNTGQQVKDPDVPYGVLTPALAMRNMSDSLFKRLKAQGLTYEKAWEK